MADPQRCHGWGGVYGCPRHVDGRRVRALMAEQLLSEPDVVGHRVDAGTEPVAELVSGGGDPSGMSPQPDHNVGDGQFVPWAPLSPLYQVVRRHSYSNSDNLVTALSSLMQVRAVMPATPIPRRGQRSQVSRCRARKIGRNPRGRSLTALRKNLQKAP